MKILVATDTYSPQVNGVVTILEETIPKLAQENEIVLIAPSKSTKKIEEDGVKKYFLKGHNFPFYQEYLMVPFAEKQIEEIIKKEKPDLVHLHAPVMIGISTLNEAKKKGIPTIITHHTHFPDYIGHTVGKRLPKFMKSEFKKIVQNKIKNEYDKANLIIVPSTPLKEELEKLGVRNTEVIENGVDFSNLKEPSKEEVEEFRKRYALEGKKIILYLGRVSAEKKIEILIDAMKEIEQAVLVIVGKGPHTKKLMERAQREKVEKKVVFAGFVKNKAIPYKCADLFASASDTETFGLTFIEAMWFEKPTVGANSLGAKEVIIDAQTGFLINEQNSKEYAKKINQILNNPRLSQDMGKEAKNHAQRYRIENSLSKLTKIYKLQLHKS